MTALMSADQFRGELRANRKPVGGVYRVSVAQPLPVAGAERTLRFCFSDGSVDRMNDTIAAAGWDLTDFQANPVALWAHDSSAPPIGGARNVGVEGDRLLGDIEFAPPAVGSVSSAPPERWPFVGLPAVRRGVGRVIACSFAALRRRSNSARGRLALPSPPSVRSAQSTNGRVSMPLRRASCSAFGFAGTGQTLISSRDCSRKSIPKPRSGSFSTKA